jgi:tetratricopeptide (TPR) repeat protein
VPSAITAYRILIEVPDDLGEERQAFIDTVHAFNESDAVPRGVLFVPVGWEAGIGRSRDSIDEDLSSVDYFVLILADQWPDGAREVYELASKQAADPASSLCQILPFFKPVPPRQLSDPGEKLREVLTFREQLESGPHMRFETYGTLDHFSRRLRWHLGRWLIDCEQKAQLGSGEEPSSKEAAPEPMESVEERGWMPHPLERTAEGFNKYGLFLQRQGMTAEAEDIHRQAIQMAREKGQKEQQAIAYGNLGEIYHRREEREKAEEMFRKALAICEDLDNKAGMAACCSGLGVVYRSRGELDRADEMFRRALQLEQKLGREAGMVAAYGNLEVIYRRRNQPDEANRLRRLSTEIREEPEYPTGSLFPGAF